MKYGLVVSLAAAAALLALYVNFVEVFVQANLLQGATTLELGIFALQFAKIVTIVSVKPLRNSASAFIIDILGAELVVFLPALVIGNLYFGVQSAPTLMVQILLGWIAGVAAFGTPFATYRLAKAMIQGDNLVVVLPSGVFLSELMILLVAGANSAAASGLGLAGLSRAILLVGAGGSTVGAQVAGVTALPPLAILYVSLLLYALAPGEEGQLDRLRSLAGLALLATAVTYAGTYAASLLSLTMTYLVLPPTLLAVTLMWWATREV
jgi:hypothetical protein